MKNMSKKSILSFESSEFIKTILIKNYLMPWTEGWYIFRPHSKLGSFLVILKFYIYFFTFSVSLLSRALSIFCCNSVLLFDFKKYIETIFYVK